MTAGRAAGAAVSVSEFDVLKFSIKTIDLSTRLRGITTEIVGFIPRSLVLRSIVLGRILLYRNWSIHTMKKYVAWT